MAFVFVTDFRGCCSHFRFQCLPFSIVQFKVAWVPPFEWAHSARALGGIVLAMPDNFLSIAHSAVSYQMLVWLRRTKFVHRVWGLCGVRTIANARKAKGYSLKKQWREIRMRNMPSTRRISVVRQFWMLWLAHRRRSPRRIFARIPSWLRWNRSSTDFVKLNFECSSWRRRFGELTVGVGDEWGIFYRSCAWPEWSWF